MSDSGAGISAAKLPSKNETNKFLSLPSEILNQIYEYLDWHPFETGDLHPAGNREHLLNARLVCRRLNEATSPLVFRTVGVGLRWNDIVHALPWTYFLRRSNPELSSHIRNVHIDARMGADLNWDNARPSFPQPARGSLWKLPQVSGFEAFEEEFYQRAYQILSDIVEDTDYALISPDASSPSDNAERSEVKVQTALRALLHKDSQLCRDIANDMYHNSSNYLGSDGFVPANDALTADLQRRQLRLRLHSLAYILLALPPRPLAALSINLIPGGAATEPLLEEGFVAEVATQLLQLHGRRSLTHLAFDISHAVEVNRRTSNRNRSRAMSSPRPMELSRAAVRKQELEKELSLLTNLTTLALPLLEEDEGGSGGMMLLPASLEPIQTRFVSTLEHIIIRNTTITPENLLWFLRPFADPGSKLRRLTLDNLTLWLGRMNGQNLGRVRADMNQDNTASSAWLKHLRDLRAIFKRKSFQLKLKSLKGVTDGGSLPAGAIEWLMHETDPRLEDMWRYSTPIGESADKSAGKRRERLEKDFVGLMPLWRAEERVNATNASPDHNDDRARWASLANQAMMTRFSFV